MKRYILSVDAGTSSFRTALYDYSGKMVSGSLGRETYPLKTDEDGRATLEAKQILSAFEKSLQTTLQSVKSLKNSFIDAVGISFFWHSLIGLDKNGRPTTDVITWADGRCRSEAEVLRKKWSEEQYHATTGCMIRSAYWPAKLLWLRENNPQAVKKTKVWISPAELIVYEMTGQIAMSHSMAAGTGLYDQKKGIWSSSIYKKLNISENTLPVVSNNGFLTSESMAKKYPLLAKAHWFAGIGDGAASNLGLGATNPETVAINFGTSAAIRVLTPMPKQKIPFGLFCYRLDESRVLVGGAITNAGIVRAWFDKVYGVPSDKNDFNLQELKLRSLPFLAPERAPTWPEELPGVTVGFVLESNKEQHYHSMIESTFLRLNQIRTRLQKWSGRKLQYRLGGGVANSPQMVQKFADAFASTVSIVEESEASIRGAAIYVLQLLDANPLTPQIVKSFAPRKNRSLEYQKETQKQEVFEEEYKEFYKKCLKRGLKL